MRKLIPILLILVLTVVLQGCSKDITAQYTMDMMEDIKKKLERDYEIEIELNKDENKYVIICDELEKLSDKEKYEVVEKLSDEIKKLYIGNIKDGVICDVNTYTYGDTINSQGYRIANSNSLYKNNEIIYTERGLSTSEIGEIQKSLEAESNEIKFSRMSSDEKIILAKQQVKKNLKDSSSAKFSDVSFKDNIVTGKVTSKNSFNANVTNTFIVTFDLEGNATVSFI